MARPNHYGVRQLSRRQGSCHRNRRCRGHGDRDRSHRESAPQRRPASLLLRQHRPPHRFLPRAHYRHSPPPSTLPTRDPTLWHRVGSDPDRLCVKLVQDGPRDCPLRGGDGAEHDSCLARRGAHDHPLRRDPCDEEAARPRPQAGRAGGTRRPHRHLHGQDGHPHARQDDYAGGMDSCARRDALDRLVGRPLQPDRGQGRLLGLPTLRNRSPPVHRLGLHPPPRHLRMGRRPPFGLDPHAQRRLPLQHCNHRSSGGWQLERTRLADRVRH